MVTKLEDESTSEGSAMSKRRGKASYWQEAPLPRDQLVLFTDTLEDRIPEDHPVRVLDEVLSSLDWQDWEATYNGQVGQPPIHPSVMAKVLLFALMRRIRSTRQIEYNLRHSIDFIWLASGRVIDHSTLSEFRRKYPQQLKAVYRQLVKLAIDMGLAKLVEVCIDGTRVRADANRFRTLTADQVEKLLEELDEQMTAALKEMETNDALDSLVDDGQRADQLPSELRDKQVRKEQLEAALSQLQEMDRQRKRDGINPQKNPAQLPVTDSDSRILPNKEGGYAPNYTPMAVTETENGFLVGVDVLIGNNEQAEMISMIDALSEDYGETPETVMGDGVYATGSNLEATEARDIELLSPPVCEEPEDNPSVREDPTQPVADEDLDRLPINAQTKRFAKQAFVYDEAEDVYYCPAGKPLKREGTEKVDRSSGTLTRTNYRSQDCSGCPLAARCRTNPDAKGGRKVTRDNYESTRRRHSEQMRQPEARERYKRRLHNGEIAFAVLKATMGLRRFLLRGIEGAQQEWLWASTAYNLKKLISLLGVPRADQSQVAATMEN
ncbi:IS1182 family transposase [Candidatus Uhrbacteria bacterium]|nr:IS1182 family transposase [Candidatus Uhrbacteria bacterium]